MPEVAAAMVPGGATRLAAVLGWPVRHSRSPAIMNAAFAAAGVDAVHLALPTPPDDLPVVVRALAAVGALGANVTVPHKVAVVGLCDTLGPEAALVGAVNCLALTDGRVVGDNTDAVGLGRALVVDPGASALSRTLVLGAGGAARAAVVALGRLGATVDVAARRPDAAADLVGLAVRAGARPGRALPMGDADLLAHAVGEATAVLNATSVGLGEDRLPIAVTGNLHADQVAYDLVYGDGPTPFLAAASTVGARAIDGWSMLVEQAAVAFERWTGLDAPRDVMRAAARR